MVFQPTSITDTFGTITQPKTQKLPPVDMSKLPGQPMPAVETEEPELALTPYEQAWQRVQEGMKQGQARGKELFGEGKLGRIQHKPSWVLQRDDLFNRLRGFQQGLTAPQFGAMRSRAVGGLDSELATNLRQHRAQAAQSGVRGAAAMAGAQNLMQGSQDARSALERDLLIKDIDLQRQGSQDMQRALGQFGDQDLNMQRFNLGQQSREAFGRAGTEMGYGGLSSQLYGGVQQNDLLRQLMNQAGNYPVPGEPGGMFEGAGQGIKQGLYNVLKYGAAPATLPYDQIIAKNTPLPSTQEIWNQTIGSW